MGGGMFFAEVPPLSDENVIVEADLERVFYREFLLYRSICHGGLS